MVNFSGQIFLPRSVQTDFQETLILLVAYSVRKIQRMEFFIPYTVNMSYYTMHWKDHACMTVRAGHILGIPTSLDIII